jgi:aspartyl-tRNA(Asn)/glutamyl-tRNA(Gln) amidotransferase subunit A
MSEPRTITAAAELIRRGDLTPSELLEQCLARIDRFEERVRAWVHLDLERARADATKLTDELKAGRNRGPLHGIPIGIKDIIDVFDMPTGCGSKLWANSYARRDATCVERLRQAGAVILGKTVTTAYASFDPPVTRNPWNLDRTPGGSSSGSAAAVACGMCLGALASQSGGSITRPASFCGVYGLKPTYGRVSVDGVMPLAPSLDHVGVMGNCVRDLAILLQPIARTDTKTLTKPTRYTSAIDPPAPQRPRQLAPLPEFPARASADMTTAFLSLRERSRPAGWAWYDLPLPPSFSAVPRNHQALMGVEAAAFHADRMRRRPEDYPPRITELIRHGLSISAPEFADIRKHLTQFRTEIDYAFINNWRAFITPATIGPAPIAETTGDPAFNSPWSYSGLPTLSLPFAWDKDGMPLAVQLVGENGGEPDLFAVAAMLEETIGFEPRPLPL